VPYDRRAIAVLIAATGLSAAGSNAATVTIGPSQDNTIYAENGTVSNGAGEHIFAGRTNDGNVRRALVQFDIAAAVPAGSTISSVSLTLHLSRTRTQNQTVSLRRVLASWGEGTSNAGGEEGGGAAAVAPDATWTYRRWQTSLWTAPGGDYNGTVSASTTIGGGTGDFTWSSATMTADVQGWLNTPSGNFGWMVFGNESGTKVTKRFDSRENTTAAYRPRLVINFTAPALTGACCAEDGGCSVVLDPGSSCAAPSAYQGGNTSCTPNLCPQPTGACCLPNASATCDEVTAAECTAALGTFHGEFSQCAETSCPVVLTPYLDPLPIPAVAQPTSGTSGGTATYDIAMREVHQQLHAQLPPTTVWGYGDHPTGASYPGPTIEATVGNPVTVHYTNDLRDTAVAGSPLRTTHYLPVDTCPVGADDQSARAIVHLHGGHVPANSDGFPENAYLPGAGLTVTYPNQQLPATKWFHDHAMGITRLNVYMGLAAFYLIRDSAENALGLPSGAHEVALAIQDRSFHPDGSLAYPILWEDMFLGENMLVNGKVWPYLNVDSGKYRLRLLNGCNSRTLALQFCPNNDTSPCGSPATFSLLGEEGGLLETPVSMTQVTLGPAERADVAFDFAPYAAGTPIYLVNSAPAPFPGEAGVGVVPRVMKFIVGSAPGHTAPLPTSLRPVEHLLEANAVAHRTFELSKGTGDACSAFRWQIATTDGLNGAQLGSRWADVTEFPVVGTTEVWSFVNRSGVTHPMHLHQSDFQVLDRQAFSEVNGVVQPIGSPVPPPAHEAGWKDTVQVGPNEIVRVIVRFADYEGVYPYHCHIVEHEDHEMMRAFQVMPEPSRIAMFAAGVALLELLAVRGRWAQRRSGAGA
jgi:spore coat protein A